jgi:uncharacterized protein (DUF362 family)
MNFHLDSNPASPIPHLTASLTASQPVPSVFLSRASGRPSSEIIRDGFDWVHFSEVCTSTTRIFIKPNLTFPSYRPGVMTSPEFIDSLLAALRPFTSHLFIGDSDSGGYNRFSAETVFRSTGLYSIARKYGAQVVNLTGQPCVPFRVHRGEREEPLLLPALLVEEMDFLISVPVPKVHVYTTVSLSLKNLWGCIPANRDRLLLHPWLEEILPQLRRAVKARFAVVDGNYGLNRNGPMRGDPIFLDWMLLSDDLFAGDRTVCEILGLDWRRVGHLSGTETQGQPAFIPPRVNQEPGIFHTVDFFLRRNPTDLPGWLAFHSSWTAWLAYFSPAAAWLHRILYLIRKPFYDYSQVLPLDAPASTPSLPIESGKTDSRK